MFNLPHGELETIRDELDLARAHHEEWFDALNRNLICALPHDAADVSGDAHHLCRFGEWYYTRSDEGIREHPAFVEIGVVHKEMHARATELLLISASGRRITTAEYDPFASAIHRLHMQMDSLRHEVEEAITNLDPLTGIFSRKSMLGKLRELHEIVKRRVHPVTLAMMDIDRFKRVNDRFGHLVGDRALQVAAQHILQWTRPYDFTFRYGGEEFLICLYNTGIPEALEIVERIRVSLEKLSIPSDGDEAVSFTVSFGLARLEPDVPVEEAIRRADTALYQAKNSGRNNSQCWSEEMRVLQS